MEDDKTTHGYMSNQKGERRSEVLPISHFSTLSFHVKPYFEGEKLKLRELKQSYVDHKCFPPTWIDDQGQEH